MGSSSEAGEPTNFGASRRDPLPLPPPSVKSLPLYPHHKQSLNLSPMFSPPAAPASALVSEDNCALSLSSREKSRAVPRAPARKQPLDFHAVWFAIMSNPLIRLWMFTNKPPDVHELLLAREHGPFEKSFIVENFADDFDGYRGDMGFKRFHEVFGSCHKLSCGSHLGFVMNNMGFDVTAGLFSAIDPIFSDASMIVTRMVAMCLNNILVHVEFCWLKSGALSVRFYPFSSISSGTRGDLKLAAHIYGFKPSDAQKLTECALGTPNSDLLNANFDALRMQGYYCYEMFDTKYQAACIYCRSRGMSICDCPMPMRRRWSNDEDIRVIPYEISRQGSTWNELGVAKLLCARPGSLIFNCKMRPHSSRQVVLFSGSFPFDFKIQSQLYAHPVLQRHMRLSNYAINPVSLIMYCGTLLETSKDSAEKHLAPLESSSSADKRLFNQTDADVNTGNHRQSAPSAEKLMKTDVYTDPTHNTIEYHNYAPTINVNVQKVFGIQQPEALPPQGESGSMRCSTSDSAQAEPKAVTSTMDSCIRSSSNSYSPSPGPALPPQSESVSMRCSSNDPVQAKPKAVASTMDSCIRSSSNSYSPSPGPAETATRVYKKKRAMRNLGVEMKIIKVDGVNKRSWKCPKCDMVILNKKSNLTRHMDTKHKTATSSFRCTFKGCELSFQTNYNRKRHFLSAHLENSSGHQINRARCKRQ